MSNKEPTLMEMLQASVVIDNNIAVQNQEADLREALAKASAAFGGNAAPAPQIFAPAPAPLALEAIEPGGDGGAPLEPLANLYPGEDGGASTVDPDFVEDNEPDTALEVLNHGQTGSNGLDATGQIGDGQSVGPIGQESETVGSAGEGQGAEGVLTDTTAEVSTDSAAPAAPASVVTSPWEVDDAPAASEQKPSKKK